MSWYSSRIDIFVRAVDQASSTLNKVGRNVKRLAGSFDFLRQAASVAFGMIMRDMVRGAVDFVGSGVEMSAKLESLKASFERLVRASGATNLSLESLRKATRGTVSDVELLQAANQALMLGLPADQLNELFEAAMKLGHAMGIDMKTAVESLATGIGRQSKLILDNLGVTFQASDAYEWYAKQLGVTANQLTENQKRLAWQKYAMMMVTEKAKELGDVISESQLKLEQYRASVENSKAATGGFMQSIVQLGMSIKQALGPLGVMVDVLGPSALQGVMIGLANSVIPALTKKIWGWITASKIVNLLEKEKIKLLVLSGLKLVWYAAKAIAVAFAEKARAAATFIANAVSSLGAAVPLMLAAAATVGALMAHFAGVFQEGGVVPRTGWAYVHKGELIIPPHKMGFMNANITVNVNNPVFSRDYDVDRMMQRVILRLKQAGIPID